MTTPTLKVEISFASAPLATSPTWVDVTSKVRHIPGLTITRGRQSEVSTFSAGRLQLVLNNRDRLFDPLNASGTYYGKLTPRRQVRITATWSGVTYNLFRGHVVGWPQNYPATGRDVVVDLEAYDAIGWLAETTLPNPIESYADSVDAVRMFRNIDTTGWVDAYGNLPMPLAGTVLPGTTNLRPAAVAPAVSFTGVESYAGTYESIVSGGAFSVAFWVETTTVGASATSWRSILARGPGQNSTAYFARIGIDSSGAIRYSGWDFNPGFRPEVTSSVNVADGQPHYVVITQSVTGPQVWVDGVNRSASVTNAPSSMWVLDVAYGTATGDVAFIGALGDIGYFTKVLSEAEINELYGLGYGARLQSTATRAGRVLDAVGWPSAWRSLSTTTRGECWDLAWEGRSALAELQTIAATEQGRMFADGDNKLTLQSRYAALEDTRGKTVQATFSDDGAGVAYQEFSGFDYNDKDVANEVRVSCSFGTETASDSTSITDYGLQSTQVSTQLPSLQLAADMAAGLVTQRKTPKIRARPLMAMGQTQTTNWPTLLGLEIGDRIKVEITPLGVGSQVAQELIVERISWSITADRWELDIAGSPAPTNFFVLDTSVLDTGLLGF